MAAFDRQEFINNVKNVINRVSNMKDKVKALKTLDNFQDKNEKDNYLFIFEDNDLWDIYTDIIIKWQEIKRTLTEKESDRYGNSLPDEMLDINWCKNTREVLQYKIKEAREKIK